MSLHSLLLIIPLSKSLSLWFMSETFNTRRRGCFDFQWMSKTHGSLDNPWYVPFYKRRNSPPLSSRCRVHWVWGHPSLTFYLFKATSFTFSTLENLGPAVGDGIFYPLVLILMAGPSLYWLQMSQGFKRMRAVDLEKAQGLILDEMRLAQLVFTPTRGRRSSVKVPWESDEPFVCEHTEEFTSWAVNIYCCFLPLFALWADAPPGVLKMNIVLVPFCLIVRGV